VNETSTVGAIHSFNDLRESPLRATNESPLRAINAPPPSDNALWLACSGSPVFFLDRCGHLYDEGARDWVRFRLWPAQAAALEQIAANRLAVVLKARQLGMSWLTVGYALWQMVFRPGATVLFFSKRDDEAVELLNFRLRGMYDRLPPIMRAKEVMRSNTHELYLSNGSRAFAFPTTGGRGRTASLAIVDEADHTDDLDALLNAVKPTVDAGGQLILLSTVDKARPESPFQRIYRAAAAGANGYTPIFLPWDVRPGRTPAWYAEQERDCLARTGTLDDLHQEYPATEAEALAPRAVDRFFRAEWLDACFAPLPGGDDAPASGGPPAGGGPPASGGDMALYAAPLPGCRYVIGVYAPEGNPQGAESAAVVLEVATGMQAATLALRGDPEFFAGRVAGLARIYGGAEVLVGRNDHGQAALAALRGHAIPLLRGPDGDRGWALGGAARSALFDGAAADLRTGRARLRDAELQRQLMAVDGATLAAPPGMADSRALACVLALAALRVAGTAGRGESAIIPPPRLWPGDRGDRLDLPATY
jgi:hypothetical protein